MFLILRLMLVILPLLMLCCSAWFLSLLRSEDQSNDNESGAESISFANRTIVFIDLLVISTLLCRMVSYSVVTQVLLVVIPFIAFVLYFIVKKRLNIKLTDFDSMRSFVYLLFLVFLILTALESWFIVVAHTLYQ